MRLRDLPWLVKETCRTWYQDKTARLGAALAYYTVFSLSPVLVIAVALAGMVYGKEAAEGRIASQISRTIDPQVARAVERLIQHTAETGSGPLAALLSLGVLLFSATAVFAELQDGLNTIWGVKARSGRGWLKVVTDRLWSFGAVLGIGFLLLLSVVVSTVLAAVAEFLGPDTMPGKTHV